MLKETRARSSFLYVEKKKKPQSRDANDSPTSLRNYSNFTLPAVRTECFKRSFIPSMLFSQ